MAFLTVQSGELAGQRFEIEGEEVGIGRAADNTIQVNEGSVSGRHCCVLKDGNRYTLRDLRSTNGTLLNGEAVTEARLKPGDLIGVGSVEILFGGEHVEVEGEGAGEGPGSTRTVIQPASPGQVLRAANSPFGARKKGRRTWGVVITLLALLALGALGWFLMRLFEIA